MTAITVSNTYIGVNGSIKEMVIHASSTPDTSYTYDTDMDATNGRGSEFREIFEATYNTSTGSEHVNCTWSNSTGIVTLGTLTTPTAEGYLHIKGR